MRDNNQYKIFTELADLKSNYESSRLEKIDGLYRSQYEVIKMCEYYSDSRYLGHYKGNKDKFERPVPFYNIVNYRVALAKTATDLDIKDIQIVSDHPNYEVASMLLNHEAYEWMKESEFAETLNDMGLTRPKYGGYLVKKCMEADEGLKIEVVRWTNVITDQNDVLGGPIIEIHHMYPVEIKRKDGTWENVNDLLKLHKKMQAKDRPTSIDVYEITGEFPKAVLNDALGKEDTDEDEFLFSLQHYFVADIDGQKFMLYAEELKGEMEDYYEYLAWEDNGYGLGRGVIEDSEEAQVWTNDAVINESIAMSLAGRVGIKTNSKKLGHSVLEHDHGKIYELEDGKDINSFSLVPAALGQYQNQIEKWRAQADNVTSSYNAVTGENPPSGTPYSQTALLNQVATKPFDYKREVWGIHLTKLFENWVIPYLIKKLYKEHILVSEFTDTELQMIDDSFAAANGNSWVKEQLLKGQTVDPADQQAVMNTYKDHIKKLGKKRYIEIRKGYFDGIECKVTVITTGEQKNKAVILQSLSQIMRDVIASFNPNTGEFGVLTDPTLSKIFNTIVEMSGSGISPVSLGKGTKPTKQVPQAPTAPIPSPMEAPSMPATPVSAPLAQ